MRTAILSTVILSSLAFAQSPVESAKVYLGAEGARLEVLMLKPATDKKCVLRFSATATDFDGRALPCTLEDSGGARYHLTVHGSDWVPAIGSRNATGELTLYVPGNKQLSVKYDEKASKELKVDELYKVHKAQEASGALAAFAKFDRPAEQARQDKRFTELVDAANKVCGTALTGKIAWTSVSDEVLNGRAVYSFCGAPFEAMRGLCRYKAAREVFAAKLSSVACTWAPTKLELKDKTLNVAFNETSSNLDETTTTWLKQNL